MPTQLTQSEWEKINDIAASIHGIKNSAAMRNAFLQKLMNLIDFSFSDFEIGLLNSSYNPRLVDPVVVSKYDKKFEEDFISQYESTYAAIDYVKWVFLSPESLVYRESDLVNDQIRKKSPFYIQYLQVFDLVNIAGIVISSNGNFVGAVTLYKSEKNGDFSDKDIYILKQLLPHLQTRFELDPYKINENEKSVSYLLKNKYGLTNREIEVMGFVFNGLGNKEIAEMIRTSENTVKKHVYNIYDKIEVNSRTMLTQFIIKNQLSGLWQA